MADRSGSRSSEPGILRGSVVVHRRRCGKANCRCAGGGDALHESTVLSYSQAGKTRFVMLPASEVNAVVQAVGRFRVEQQRLEQRAESALAELVARLDAARRRA